MARITIDEYVSGLTQREQEQFASLIEESREREKKIARNAIERDKNLKWIYDNARGLVYESALGGAKEAYENEA